MFSRDNEGALIINKNGVVIELTEDELMDLLLGLQYVNSDRFDKPGTVIGSCRVGPVMCGRPRPRLVNDQYLEEMATNQDEAHRGPGD